MKKEISKWIVWVGLMCLPVFSLAAEQGMDVQPVFEEKCIGNIDFVDNYGGGDEVRVRYHNAFARFIMPENGAPDFWFYVYQKGEMWLCEGSCKENYSALPEYIAVRVYQSNQEDRILAQYNAYDMGLYIMNANGGFTPFYFVDNGHHAVLNYLQPNTVILSADIDGYSLGKFEVGRLHEIACGQEETAFTDLLHVFTLN